MAKLIRDYGKVICIGASPALRNELLQLGAYKAQGYEWSDAFKRGVWDGYIHLTKYHQKTDVVYIPWGFWREALEICKKYEDVSREIVVQDCAEIPDARYDWVLSEKCEPRYYQEAALEACIKSPNGGVLQVPTGGGKTLIAAMIACHYSLPTLFVVRSLDILTQTQEVLQNVIGGNPNIRVIRASRDIRKPFPDIALCSINTLHSAFKRTDKKHTSVFQDFMEHYSLLIGDECHQAGTTQFLMPLARSTAALRVFCSATPTYGKDYRDMPLKGLAGDMFYFVGIQELIAKGYLTQPEIRFISVSRKNPDTIREWRYQQVYERGIVKNAVRNKMGVALAKRLVERGKKVLILVVRKAHGLDMKRQLGAAGINATYLSGWNSAAARKYASKRFIDSRKGECIIATVIFDVGINLPNLDALILLAGGKQQLRAVQRLGRALRTFKGKEKALMFDFMDFQDSRYLLKHSRSRYNAYRKMGFAVKRVAFREEYK